MEKKDFVTQLTEYEKKLQNYHMPHFRELPDIGLYMDQVISYVNKTLNVFGEENPNLITPSMINNYVKHGILPPPNGKKYSNVHLAYICAVYFLKQVLSMDEIKATIAHQIKCSNEYKAYTYFCNELEDAFKNCCLLTKKVSDRVVSPADDTKYALKAVTISIANLLYAQKVISLHAAMDKAVEEEANKKERITKEQEKQREKELKEEKKKEKKSKKQDKQSE